MDAYKLFEVSSTPSEEKANRSGERRQYYLNENILVDVLKNDIKIQGNLLDITPEGIGITFPRSNLKQGDLIKVRVSTANSTTSWVETEVVYASNIRLGSKILFKYGLKFKKSFHDFNSGDLRKFCRFQAHENYCPTAYCLDPISFNEKIYFQIKDISAGGFRLSTSLSNKSLIPGTELTLKITVPLASTYDQSVIIKHTFKNEKTNMYELGVKVDKPNSELMDALSEYVFSMSDVSLSKLRDQGFKVHNPAQGLIFKYPDSEAEWDQLLDLRLRSYQAVGKFSDKSSPGEMRDNYDQYARQIIALSSSRIIAAGRVVFIEHKKERSEHVKYGLDLPSWVFEEKVCEFSRACIDPEYRSSEIFAALLQHFGRVAYQSGCKYVLANCNDNLWPVYKSTGFKKVGITFDIPGIKNCHLIYSDVSEMFSGKSGGFLGWNQIVYPIAKFLKQRHQNPLSFTKDFIHGKMFQLIRRLRKRSKKKK